jgi:hypothetical protein
METAIVIFVQLLQGYLLLGLLFAILFSWKGLKKVDPATVGSSLWFKLLILPGLCAFWPFMLYKWTKIKGS